MSDDPCVHPSRSLWNTFDKDHCCSEKLNVLIVTDGKTDCKQFLVAHFSCHALTHQHCELMPRISLRVGCSRSLVMLRDFLARSISDDLTQRHGNTDTRYLNSTYEGCARTIAAERHGAPPAPSAVSRTQGLPLGCRSVAPCSPRETPEQKPA